MSSGTSIEWTATVNPDGTVTKGSSWNPLRGTKGRHYCVRVSPGCKNCYAATMNQRFRGPDYVVGADEPRLDEDALLLPLRWRKPRRIFVCSMTDLFLESHRDEWIDRVFAVMALRPQHTFQVLTKRAERMRDYVNGLKGDAGYNRLEACARALGYSLWFQRIPMVRWPIPSIWLGVSCENQQYADERIPLLLQTPAAVRWVSAEPLIGPIDLRHRTAAGGGYVQFFPAPGPPDPPCNKGAYIDWVVVGGESGPGARPFDLAWARSIVQQCRAAVVPCFVKQLGSWPLTERFANEITVNGVPLKDGPAMAGNRVLLHDRKGGDIDEWPKDLRVRQYPGEVIDGRS